MTDDGDGAGVDGSLSRAGRRLPAWVRTVRVRLALTYSALLFAVAALAARRGVPRPVDVHRGAAARRAVTVKKFRSGRRLR